jgi:integrase/recombinase XerD
MDEWAGKSFGRGCVLASSCRSARCSASQAGRPADAAGRPPPRERSFGHAAVLAGVRRRFAPHQLRRAHAVEMAREGVLLIVIQRQLGHTNLGITSIYLLGIDSAEIIDAVHARCAAMIPVDISLPA